MHRHLSAVRVWIVIFIQGIEHELDIGHAKCAAQRHISVVRIEPVFPRAERLRSRYLHRFVSCTSNLKVTFVLFVENDDFLINVSRSHHLMVGMNEDFIR